MSKQQVAGRTLGERWTAMEMEKALLLRHRPRWVFHTRAAVRGVMVSIGQCILDMARGREDGR